MTKRKSETLILSAPAFLALILDSRTGFSAAREGVTLCLTTLIPSMFPFFMLSILLTNSLLGQPIHFLRPVATLCRIPEGTESLLAIGLLGGYPVGAQNVITAYQQGSLSREDAQRMAVFCNNAGPAFLFGYLGPLFDNPFYPWLIWGIQMVSAFLVGWFLPCGIQMMTSGTKSPPLSISQALNQSLRVMGQVCGWVILFRVVIGFLERWCFWTIPKWLSIFLAGLLELSNGCIQLTNFPSNGLRMMMASVFLGFGGLCVLLQTLSITNSLPIPMYLPGKILQGLIAFLLAYLTQFLLPDANPYIISPYLLVVIGLSCMTLTFILRKEGNNSSNLLESIV